MGETTAPVGTVGPPPHVQVTGMIMAALPSRVLAGVAQHGIPDVLGEEAKTSAEVAKAMGAYEQWVHRLLRATASLGVFRASPDGRFANSPLSDALRSDTPNGSRPAEVKGWFRAAGR